MLLFEGTSRLDRQLMSWGAANETQFRRYRPIIPMVHSIMHCFAVGYEKEQDSVVLYLAAQCRRDLQTLRVT